MILRFRLFGPSFIISENQNSKLGEANLELAIGYISYKNDSRIIRNPLKITGGDLGVIGGFGYHFRLAPNFLIGLANEFYWWNA